MALTLKELIKMSNEGYDVADDIFDWATNYDYDIDLEDYYGKALDLMASEIEVVKIQPKWYTICKFSEFIEKYQDVFDKFFNEENKEVYTPKYACKELGVDRLNKDMEEFYDIYLNSLESLIAGNYCESDYKKLYEMLSKAMQSHRKN